MIYWFLCLYRRPLFWFNLRHKSKILHFSLSTNGWSACRFFDLSSILSLYISIDSEWSTDSYVCIVGLYFLTFNLRHKSKIDSDHFLCLYLFRPTNGWSACRFFDLSSILSLYISFDSEWSTDSYVCIVGLYFDLIFDINLKYFISLFRPMDDQLAGFSISLPFFRYISQSIQNDLLILMFVS